MKAFLITTLLINTVYVLIVSGNPNVLVFIAPAAVYIVTFFILANLDNFLNLFKEPEHE